MAYLVVFDHRVAYVQVHQYSVESLSQLKQASYSIIFPTTHLTIKFSMWQYEGINVTSK